MRALAMVAVGVALCLVAVFVDPPFTLVWVAGVPLLLAGLERRRVEAPARRARARAAARRGWLHE